MTRLCYIHNIAMPGPEANTVNVAKMCDAFAASECEVTLIALPGDAARDMEASVRAHYGLSEHVRVRPLPRACARPVLAAMAGVAMARRCSADIVYTRAPHVAWAACLAGLATALELHTGANAFASAGRTALRAAGRHPHLKGVIAISSALARQLETECGLRDVIVAHDGAEAPAASEPASRNARFTAGFLGRFYPGKGVELIAQLAPLCPWADFHLVGGDRAAAEHLTGARLPDNVICRGAVPHADAARVIAGWDVALAPYQHRVLVADGRTDAAQWMSPLKIFEYMAASMAILASDLPAIREVLSNGETAILLPPDQPAAWASALERVRADPNAAASLGQSARETLLAHYTWTQRARRILAALRGEVVSSRAP